MAHLFSWDKSDSSQDISIPTPTNLSPAYSWNHTDMHIHIISWCISCIMLDCIWYMHLWFHMILMSLFYRNVRTHITSTILSDQCNKRYIHWVDNCYFSIFLYASKLLILKRTYWTSEQFVKYDWIRHHKCDASRVLFLDTVFTYP